MRRLHGRRDERLGPHRPRRVGHVHDRDARGLVLQLLDRLDREEQGGVVVRALVSRLVHEPLHLESTGVAFVAGELGVADVTVVGHARRDAPLQPRLRPGARSAVGTRRHRQLGGTVLRGRRGRQDKEEAEGYEGEDRPKIAAR